MDFAILFGASKLVKYNIAVAVHVVHACVSCQHIASSRALAGCFWWSWHVCCLHRLRTCSWRMSVVFALFVLGFGTQTHVYDVHLYEFRWNVYQSKEFSLSKVHALHLQFLEKWEMKLSAWIRKLIMVGFDSLLWPHPLMTSDLL